MKSIKKYAGIIWILTGLAAAYYNVMVMGIPRIMSGKQDDLVFGLINIILLTPIIAGGLITFGYYALKGEYDR